MNKWAQQKGSSLIEVLVALALVSVTLAGAVASQLRVGHAERSAARREQATMIAASIAAAMRDPSLGAHALAHWKTVAASALPRAKLSIVDHAPGVALALVEWAEAPATLSALSPQAGNDCSSPGGRRRAGFACAAVPFVQ